MGERFPLPFPTYLPSLPLLSLPCRESAPWKPARGSESSVSFPSGVRIRILVYFELENRTWRQRVLQTLSRKTAVSARSAGTTFKNFTNKISGGISPRLYVWKQHWLPGRERSLIISSAVWIHVRDIQTDRRTPGDSKDRAYAWRRVVKKIRSRLLKKDNSKADFLD